MVMQPAPNQNESRDADELGQVLPFRRRPNLTVAPGARPHAPPNGADNDFASYEQEQEEPIDYRQRMLMNMIAVAIVILLISSGIWIADTISTTGKEQDCALQGRTNCAPIETPTRQ
jgi:hypothetical protein